MKSTPALAQLGMSAVGLGIGGALVPGIAAAAESIPSSELFAGDGTAWLSDGNAFWSELLCGNIQGALIAGTPVCTDLPGGTDAAGAAADSSNAWTELLASFDGASAAADASDVLTGFAALF